MDFNLELSLQTELIALAVLLMISALFSIAETSMMALNRYRLKAMVRLGSKAAQRTSDLLARTDRLLGVILIGNNVVNTCAATLTGVITIDLFGQDDVALLVSTLTIAFLIIVFSEITPKVIGAAFPEKIALPLSYILGPLLKILYPVVWFVNLFSNGIIWLLRINPHGDSEPLTNEELRSLVLEHSHFLPKKHSSILVNLFDIERITVEDVMVPRTQIEAINLDLPAETLLQQLSTSYHTRLLAYRSEMGNVVGVLHLRRALALIRDGELDVRGLEETLAPPYFVPGETGALAQLQYFQENRERVAFVVDEYGELEGLVTLEDIIEEIIGEFTTAMPVKPSSLSWSAEGNVLVEGGTGLRDINRKLGLQFALDGPKTLNGLILDYLQDIPESGVGLKVHGVAMEVVQTQDRIIKTVRLFKPAAPPPPEWG